MIFEFKYQHYEFKAFWSKDVNSLIKELKALYAKSYTSQHDSALKFVNERLFEGKGEFIAGQRKKGELYSDLKVPIEVGTEHITLEYKLCTSQLKYLRREIADIEDIFSRNDYFYFSFFLQRVWKNKTKILKVHDCMYYLVAIILSKKVRAIDLKELIDNIKQDAKDFTKKLAQESNVDLEEEELIGVDNIIKVVDLERENQEKDRKIKEKDDALKEKDDALKEKEKIIKKQEQEIERLRKQLKHR